MKTKAKRLPLFHPKVSGALSILHFSGLLLIFCPTSPSKADSVVRVLPSLKSNISSFKSNPDSLAGWPVFMETTPAFAIPKKDVHLLIEKLIKFEHENRHLPNRLRQGFNFSYLMQNSFLRRTVKVRFGKDGQSYLRVPGASKKTGAVKKMETVVRVGESRILARVSGKESDIEVGLGHELSILKKITHSFQSLQTDPKGVLTLADSEANNIMELYLPAFDGTLRELLSSVQRNPNHLISDLIFGLNHLHHLNIVHGDIHPENILVSDNSNSDFTGVLADFDRSQDLDHWDNDKIKFTQPYANPLYMAPETPLMMWSDESVEDKIKLIKKRDVFSLGIILHSLLLKGYPPAIKTCQSLFAPPGRSSFPTKCYIKWFTKRQVEKEHTIEPFDLNDLLLTRMLDPEPKYRASSEQVLEAWNIYRSIEDRKRSDRVKVSTKTGDIDELISKSTLDVKAIDSEAISKLTRHLKNRDYVLVAAPSNFMETHTMGPLAHLYFVDSWADIQRINLNVSILDIDKITQRVSFLKALDYIRNDLSN